jgi:hypothetical protein
MTKRKLKFLSDSGHAWLSVALADLVTLGIEDDISSYSYMNGTRAFLEEDCDAGIFLDAAKAAGWDVTYKESYTDGSHPLRSLSHYKPYFAKNPFKSGSKFSYKGFNGLRVGDRLVMVGTGHAYSIRKSNPLLAMDAPELEEGESAYV